MKLTTAIVEEQTMEAINDFMAFMLERISEDVYGRLEEMGVDISDQDEQELIDRTVIEMIDQAL